jgi:hypothetical protein
MDRNQKRNRFAALAVGLLALAVTQSVSARPVWSHYPGFYSPGFAGIVAVDLDDDGIEEAVLTGASGGGFSPSGTQFMAVLKARPNNAPGYRVIALRRLASGESITGQIARIPGTGGSGDRVVATLSTSLGSRAVQFAGLGLEPVATVALPNQFRQSMVGDVDGDGELELLGTRADFYGEGPATLVGLNSGTAEWTDSVNSVSVGAGQLDGDPALELILSTTSTSGGRVLDGASRITEWTYPDGFSGRIAVGNFLGSPSDREFAAVSGWGATRIFVSQPVYSPVREYNTGEVQAIAVRDINADQIDELIMGQGQWGSVIAYGTTSGVPLFTFSNPEHGVSAVAVGQFDADPALELIHGAGLTSSGRDIFRVLSIPGGEVEFLQSDEGGSHSSAARGDIDGNGIDEVVFTTTSSDSGYSGANLYVLDSATGERLRNRSDVLEAWGSNEGVSIKLANLDGDPQLEIVLGLGQLYNARVAVLDGLTLADQWGKTLDTAFVSDLLIVDRPGGPAVAVATGGRIVLLNRATGDELWRSVSFQTNGAQTLAAGNFDGDANEEISLSVGTRAYIIDPSTGLLDRIIDLSDSILGQRVENGPSGCLHVIVQTTELRRLNCTNGALVSTRTLPFQATLVAFPGDSTGPLVVGDGNRVRLDQNGANLAEQSGLGTRLGWRNRAVAINTPEGVELAIGSDDSVHMLRLVERLFGNGFE